MKTIAEIKSEMTAAILANTVLVEAMELDTNRTWDEQTSAASVMNVLLYIVAVSWYALQWIFDQFKKDVEERILAALPGTVSWYGNRAKAFQYNDNINDSGGYDVVDESKKIIKYCAVVDAYEGVLIKVNGENHAKFVNGSDELTAFTSYINALKFAGCRITVSSLEPDELKLYISVKINPLILKSDLTTIDGNEDVIRAAVEDYLANLPYNGVFNKTKIIDAIQAVEGVEDVVLNNAIIKDETQTAFTTLSKQNYIAVSGSIKLHSIIYYNYNG